jgi:hypothetical protein
MAGGAALSWLTALYASLSGLLPAAVEVFSVKADIDSPTRAAANEV